MCPAPTAASPYSPDFPPRLGATLIPGGADFAVRAPHADAVELCLFDADGAGRGADSERRFALTRQELGVWAGRIDGVRAGQRYGYRVHGPWQPGQGQRFNPNKLLVDPYARALDGEVTWRPEIFGHTVNGEFVGDATVLDERDSAPFVPRSVVAQDDFDWGDDAPLRTPMHRTVFYEGHVRGLTKRHPGVPEQLRGTYAGIASDAFVAHLKQLGVTALELLPVHAFTSEPHLVKLGLSNYWGYNTLGYFAPHQAYAADPDPLGAISEFKRMVATLHAAGIEVILDVVFNHTCEQEGASGATLSWRGFGNADYYRLDDTGVDIDTTGCGNSLDFGNPDVVAMTLDSLRYWAREMHIDGFRFDLAPTLGRDASNEFRADHPLFVGMRADEVLSRVKLVAEPWDVGPHGWRTGQFPAPWSDWNDHFRDTVRSFWLGDLAVDKAGMPGHGISDLATRISASPDLFAARNPMASINLVTCHDGFPLADLTVYSTKHNEANGENNRDGSDNNRSWNFGVEGHSGVDEYTETMRHRVLRGMLATLMLSAGVPLLLAGDELGRTQGGNNNAYCQDNETSWLDWQLADWQDDLRETTSYLIRLRKAHRTLRQRTFFPGDPHDADERATVRWFGVDGTKLTPSRWQDPRQRTLVALFDGREVDDERLLVVWHGAIEAEDVVLPKSADVERWKLLWDSRFDRPEQTPSTVTPAGESVQAGAASVMVFVAQ